MIKLKEKVQRTMLQNQTPLTRSSRSGECTIEEEDVELAILRGISRVVSQIDKSASVTKAPPSQPGERDINAGIHDLSSFPQNINPLTSADPGSYPTDVDMFWQSGPLSDDWLLDIEMLTSGELGQSTPAPTSVGTATGGSTFVDPGLNTTLAPPSDTHAWWPSGLY